MRKLLHTCIPLFLIVQTAFAVDFIYVTTESNGIQRIDTSRNVVVGDGISAKLILGGIAITPGGAGFPPNELAFVTAPNANSVLSVDISKVQEVGDVIELGLGTLPTKVAFTNDGEKVIISNFDQNTLSIIDPATNVVTQTITLSASTQEPGELAVTPDDQFVLVANEFSGGFQIVDLDTGVPTFITITGGANNIAITSDGSTAYLSSGSSGFVYEYDLDSGTVTNSVAIDLPNDIALLSNDTQAYVSSRTSILLIDLTTMTVEVTIGPVGAPSDIAISENAGFGYVINGFNEVLIFDLSDNTVIAPISIPFPSALALAPLPNFGAFEAAAGQDQQLTQNDLFHRIRWDSHPGTSPTSHLVFTGEDLSKPLATLPGDAREFINHNRDKAVPNHYLIQAQEGVNPVASGTATVCCE